MQAAEDAWNTRDPERVAGAYTEDSEWRNRDEFVTRPGRDRGVPDAQVGARARLRLRKDLWAFGGDRIAVRFQYEWHDADGQWWRSRTATSSGSSTTTGYMRRREASINDVAIDESERRIFGPRADGDASAPPLR